MTRIEKEVLYKYRSFDSAGHSLRMLTHAELWFPSARSFNDPFDAAFTYDFDGLDGPIAEKWARSAVNKFSPHLAEEHKDSWVAYRLAELRSDKAAVEKQRQEQIEQNYDKFGICSLAGSNDNLLMWAHYGGQHTGFVVGLSVPRLCQFMNNLAERQKEVLDLIKVKYGEKFPRANFFKAMLEIDTTDYTTQFFATKSLHWSYEEEHRLIYWGHSKTSLTIGHSAFIEIVLGYRIAAENKATILDVCKQYLPFVKIFQAKKDEHNFALRLDPF